MPAALSFFAIPIYREPEGHFAIGTRLRCLTYESAVSVAQKLMGDCVGVAIIENAKILTTIGVVPLNLSELLDKGT
jgi:hypothetical protein